MGVTSAAAEHAAGVDWWSARFGDASRVAFSSAFLPALLKSSPLSAGDALSLDELRVVAKHCVADAAWQHDVISLPEFLHFLARFGPLERSAQRLVDSLTVHRELVVWFHGTITRAEAEKQLLHASPPVEDGAFLVRFSDSQPSRFCVSYLKIHGTGPHAGRREVKNVLIENVGQAGFVLTDSRSNSYPSLRVFVQRTASRLKLGVASSIARRCNLELAAVRAHQDRASNSYTTFSTELLDPLSSSSSSVPSSPSSRPQQPPHTATAAAASLLFTKSPLAGPERLILKYGGATSADPNNQVDHLRDGDGDDENYAGFAKSSFLPRQLTVTSATSATNGNQNEHVKGQLADSGYGSFSAATVVAHDHSPIGSPARVAHRRQIPVITPPAGSDYGDFASFTSAVTSFSRVTTRRQPPFMALPRHVPLHGEPPSSTSDEYASFESFVSSGSSGSSGLSAACATTMPPSDTYGAFEPFELSAPTRSTLPATPAAATTVVARPPLKASDSDDYGSFASLIGVLSLESSSPDATSPSTVSEPSSTATASTTSGSSSDVYGTFSYSPSLQAQPTELPSNVRPLTRDAVLRRSDVPSATSTSASMPLPLPPKSLPVSNAYGSFDSLLHAAALDQQQSIEQLVAATSIDAIAIAPHSAPADMTPLEDAAVLDVDPLDELNAGMAFYKAKRLDDALLRFIGAREAAQRTQDLVVEARALGNLGTVYLDKQNPMQAVTCYRQCLEITRSIQDVKRERTILNNLVLALKAAEDYESAYSYCQVQLDMTASDANRQKILTRMSELRERAARASRSARSAAAVGGGNRTVRDATV